jgi:hypothetical protein
MRDSCGPSPWLDSFSFLCFIIAVIPWGIIFVSWWGILISLLAFSGQVICGKLAFGAWLPWNYK